MNSYPQGSLVTLVGTFRDASGALVDPGAVTFKVKNPAGTTTSYTYASGAVTKVSAGVYSLNVSVTAGGNWGYRIEGTDGAQAATDGTFFATAATM